MTAYNLVSIKKFAFFIIFVIHTNVVAGTSVPCSINSKTPKRDEAYSCCSVLVEEKARMLTCTTRAVWLQRHTAFANSPFKEFNPGVTLHICFEFYDSRIRCDTCVWETKFPIDQ